jgi:hypothetical protein
LAKAKSQRGSATAESVAGCNPAPQKRVPMAQSVIIRGAPLDWHAVFVFRSKSFFV